MGLFRRFYHLSDLRIDSNFVGCRVWWYYFFHFTYFWNALLWLSICYKTGDVDSSDSRIINCWENCKKVMRLAFRIVNEWLLRAHSTQLLLLLRTPTLSCHFTIDLSMSVFYIPHFLPLFTAKASGMNIDLFDSYFIGISKKKFFNLKNLSSSSITTLRLYFDASAIFCLEID